MCRSVLTPLLFISQNPPAPPPLSDPPQIYLTSVGDPSSLTPLLPLGPVGGSASPVPPPHVSMGPQGPQQQQQQDDCVAVTGFPPHPHGAPHPSHPPPVFVIINSPPSAPPPARPPPPPIVIKEETLPSEEDLLGIVTLEEKPVEEVRQEEVVRQGSAGSWIRPLTLCSSLQVPQLICGSGEPEPPITIVESPPPPCMEPGVGGQQPAGEGQGKDMPTGNRRSFY